MKSNKHSIIFVNPVERVSVQGRHLQMFMIEGKDGSVIPTARMNKVREEDVAHQFKFPVDLNNPTGSIYTGFDRVIENPFKGMAAEEVMSEYGLNDKWADFVTKLVNQDKISKQVYYEIKHGKNPGFYTNIKSQDPKNPNYIETVKLILYPRPNRFTTETPDSEIKIELIRLHKKIADSKDKIIPGIHDWYVSQENEAEQEHAKKQEVIKKAIANLYLLQTSNTRYKNYQMASLMKDKRGDVLIKGEVSDMKVDRVLDTFIQNDTKDQMDNISQFLTRVDQLTSREGSIKFNLEYLIQQAINCNVMTSRDGYITWNSKAGTPNVSKWSNFDKMLAFFTKEYLAYSPKEKDATNWYLDLFTEVKSKGAWLEDI
jgi:hypothetical protein